MKITTKDIQDAFVRDFFSTPKPVRKMTKSDTTGEGGGFRKKPFNIDRLC